MRPLRSVRSPLPSALILASLFGSVTACSSENAEVAQHDAGAVHDASGGDAPGDAGASTLPDRFVVTADFQQGTLTVLDEAKLATAATADDALVKRIDVSAYAPGPIQLELTPDGRTALVAVGPGFFGSLAGTIGATNLATTGTTLVVDLEDGTVTDLATGFASMGLAVSPDGKTGWVTEYNGAPGKGQGVSLVDLASKTVTGRFGVGGQPEQIALDRAGALGAVEIDGPGEVQIFSTSDPAGTLASTAKLGGDPSDLAFVPGTSRVVVSNSLSPTGWVVLDVSDPAHPSVVESPTLGLAPYAVSWIPGTAEVLLLRSLTTPVDVVRIDAATTPTTKVRNYTLCNAAKGDFPLGIAVAADGLHAYAALPNDRSLCVLDLETGATHRVSMPGASGPTYAAVHPIE